MQKKNQNQNPIILFREALGKCSKQIRKRCSQFVVHSIPVLYAYIHKKLGMIPFFVIEATVACSLLSNKPKHCVYAADIYNTSPNNAAGLIKNGQMDTGKTRKGGGRKK